MYDAVSLVKEFFDEEILRGTALDDGYLVCKFTSSAVFWAQNASKFCDVS